MHKQGFFDDCTLVAQLIKCGACVCLCFAASGCSSVPRRVPPPDAVARHKAITELKLTNLRIGEVSPAAAFCALFAAVGEIDRDLVYRYTMGVDTSLECSPPIKGGYERAEVTFAQAMSDLCRLGNAYWELDEDVMDPEDPVMIKVHRIGGEHF